MLGDFPNLCHPDQANGLANANPLARGEPAPSKRSARGTWCFSGTRRSDHALSLGFTLMELMIVISIMMILLAVAVPMYNQSIVQARESVLRSNLSTLRNVISQYTLDKQKAPQSLDDLVQAGYLRQIPVDPMTREANWEVVQEDVLMAVDQQDPGITDVHSASNGTASDGTAYSSW